MGSLSLPKLPVIDFTKENLEQGTTSWSSVGEDVRHALEEHGCFIAVYGKVSPELDNDVFSMLEKTFDLPTEVKVKNTSNKQYHGYIGQQSIIPLYESLGIDDATSTAAVQEFANLMWPSAGNEDFCKTIHSYASLVSELENTVIRMVFESYGVGKYYDSQRESSTYLLRFMKYRPPQEDESKIGTLPHTDVSFLTILHQNQVNALEVQTENGDYVVVDFPSSSYIVMAGDAFMGWSNGRVKSAYHRVVMNGNKERYSLGLFSFNNGIIEIPEELVDEDHPRRFKPFDHYGLNEYLAKSFHQIEGRAIVSFCGVV